MSLELNGTTGVSLVQDGVVVTADVADSNITQAKLATGVAATGPAFSAYMSSSQTISNNTTTKVQFNTESFDTASCYDTTNYRFTPNVAGYYLVHCFFRANGTTTKTYVFNPRLLVNGSGDEGHVQQFTLPSVDTEIGGSAMKIFYLNGSSDYVEAYLYTLDRASGTTVTLVSGVNFCTFDACLIRGA